METTAHRQPISDPLLAALGPTARARASIGAVGEALAVHHLVADDGYRLVARNWRVAQGELRGELDVVVIDEPTDTLVVVEVKTRRDAHRFGGALAAVQPRQIARLRRLTGAFVREAELRPAGLRIDLVAIDLGADPTLTHVPDAW